MGDEDLGVAEPARSGSAGRPRRRGGRSPRGRAGRVAVRLGGIAGRRRSSPSDRSIQERRTAVASSAAVALAGADAPGREQVERLLGRGVAQLAAEEGLADARRGGLLAGRGSRSPRPGAACGGSLSAVNCWPGSRPRSFAASRLGRLGHRGLAVAEVQPVARPEDLRLEVARRPPAGPAEGEGREMGRLELRPGRLRRAARRSPGPPGRAAALRSVRREPRRLALPDPVEGPGRLQLVEGISEAIGPVRPPSGARPAA